MKTKQTSSLVAPLGKALDGLPPSSVVERWQHNLDLEQAGNPRVSCQNFLSHGVDRKCRRTSAGQWLSSSSSLWKLPLWVNDEASDSWLIFGEINSSSDSCCLTSCDEISLGFLLSKSSSTKKHIHEIYHSEKLKKSNPIVIQRSFLPTVKVL